MKKKKIYFWVCDYSNISGEGILARSTLDIIMLNQIIFF